MIALVEKRRFHLAVLHLVEHHPQHRGQLVILGFADARFRAERADVIRGEFLPAQTGRVKPLTTLQGAVENIVIGVWRPGAAVVVPGKLGLRVEPVADVRQHHGVELERRALVHRVARAERPAVVRGVTMELHRRANLDLGGSHVH